MSDPIEFTCGYCWVIASVSEGFAGRTISCPNCGQPVEVPAPIVRVRRPKRHQSNAWAYAGAVSLGVAIFGGILVYRGGKTTTEMPETEKPIRLEPFVPRSVAKPSSVYVKPPPPGWFALAEAFLEEYDAEMANKPPLSLCRIEPPDTMTDAELRTYIPLAKRWIEYYGVKEPNRRSNLGLSFDLHTSVFYSPCRAAQLLLPRQFARWEREGYDQLARRHLGNAAELDYIARSQGRGADALLSRSLRAELASRYPWEKRKAYFDHFRSRTGYKGEWSLLHPFDDLTSKEMGDIIDAVAEAKDGGLGNLNAREWGMLLHCGDRSFFAERLNDAKEKYKRKTPADFARE